MSGTLVDPRVREQDILNLSDNETLTLVVGPNEDKILVHKTLLSQSSDFFKSALKEVWAEGQCRAIKLQDDTLQIVSAYVNWLHTGKIFCETTEFDPDQYDWDEVDLDSLPLSQQALDYDNLALLYVFGEKIMDARFQNRVIDAIVSVAREREDGSVWFPGKDAVDTIYNRTPSSSPARKLVVHIWHDFGGGDQDLSGFHHEFLEDLAAALLNGRERPAEKLRKGKGLWSGLPRAYYNEQAGK